MNQTIVRPNEFIISVIDDGDKLRFKIINPHTRPGSDGHFDSSAYMAAYALLAMAGKLKRVKQKPLEDDDSDPELHGG